MRFKYYASKKLTAAAGTNKYDVINYQDENGSSIVVPWDAYFKCVFNTQFNSMNVANESEFNDLIGKAVVGQGFLPINNYYRQDTNLLNTFCLRPRYKSVQNEDVGINRLTTVYNGLQYGRGQNQQKPGSADPAQNVSEDIFVAYDFTADPKNADNWTNYATIKDKNQNPVYGYTSKLGMMASEFLNDYVCGENNSVYTDEGFIEEYNSTLYHSSTPYYVFTNILFNYDMTEQFSPGIYAAIYLCIALVLMAVAYTRYIRYDFK